MSRITIHKRDIIKWVDHLWEKGNVSTIRIKSTGIDSLFYILEVEFYNDK